MNSKTKIVVLHLKKLIYTGIFVALGILFLILLLIMFLSGKHAKDTPDEGNDTVSQPDAVETSYIPGIYTTSLTLGNHTLDVEVVVNTTSIDSVRLINLDEAITTMYPLIEPAFESLSEQVVLNQSTENISYADENKYTTLVLLEAVNHSLDKAVMTYDIKEGTP